MHTGRFLRFLQLFQRCGGDADVLRGQIAAEGELGRKGGLGIHDRDLHAAAELHAQGRDLAVLHVEADRAGLILHVQLLRVRCDGTGGLTRPVGVYLFQSMGIVPAKFKEVVPYMIPIVIVVIITMLLIVFVPGIASWLPNAVM